MDLMDLPDLPATLTQSLTRLPRLHPAILQAPKRASDTPTNDLTIRSAIFCNKCCSDGYKHLKQYQVTHKGLKIEAISMLNVKDKGYDKKYGFLLNDLHKAVFIIELMSDNTYNLIRYEK